MQPSKPEDYESAFLKRARWYGSLRILPDGRLRFSDWSYTDLPHVSLQVTRSVITAYCAGMGVMYLYPERNRILSACFLFILKPEQLRMAVNTLRHARGGLESWVVPALEFTFAKVSEDHPDTFKIIPELLASCGDLPVAKQWKRVRAQYFINQGMTPPEIRATEARTPRPTRAPAHRGNRGSSPTARR